MPLACQFNGMCRLDGNAAGSGERTANLQADVIFVESEHRNLKIGASEVFNVREPTDFYGEQVESRSCEAQGREVPRTRLPRFKSKRGWAERPTGPEI